MPFLMLADLGVDTVRTLWTAMVTAGVFALAALVVKYVRTRDPGIGIGIVLVTLFVGTLGLLTVNWAFKTAALSEPEHWRSVPGSSWLTRDPLVARSILILLIEFLLWCGIGVGVLVMRVQPRTTGNAKTLEEPGGDNAR